LLKKLLEKDPLKRIGSRGDANEIKKHIFFQGINFDDILGKKLKAPLSDIIKE
jgi:hypothetical protein